MNQYADDYFYDYYYCPSATAAVDYGQPAAAAARDCAQNDDGQHPGQYSSAATANPHCCYDSTGSSANYYGGLYGSSYDAVIAFGGRPSYSPPQQYDSSGGWPDGRQQSYACNWTQPPPDDGQPLSPPLPLPVQPSSSSSSPPSLPSLLIQPPPQPPPLSLSFPPVPVVQKFAGVCGNDYRLPAEQVYRQDLACGNDDQITSTSDQPFFSKKHVFVIIILFITM